MEKGKLKSMPHFEQTASVENENTRPMPERGDGRFAQNIAEESDDVAAESVQAQKAAKRETALVLKRIKQLPEKPVVGGMVSEEGDVEHQKNERLSVMNGALDDLFEISKQRSVLGVLENLKLLALTPRDLFVKMRALSQLQESKETLKKAFASREERQEALSTLSRIMNGMDDDENIKTYFSHNAKLRGKLCALGAEALLDNQDAVFESLNNPSPLVEEIVGKILSGMVTYRYELRGSTQKTDQKIEVLSNRFLPLIQKRIEILKKDPGTKSELFDHYANVLRPALLQDDKEKARAAQDVWCEAFLAGKNQETSRDMVARYVYTYDAKKRQKTGVLLNLVAHIGLDPEKFYDADKNRKSKAKENYINNILAAQALESAVPGSVRKLAGEYGIQSFSRYPKELLLRQLEAEDDLETPYGIVLNPREDWNGGFYGDQKVFSVFSDSARDEKMNVRVFECESKIDAAKKLIRLNRKYGAGQRIQFAVVGGHGNRELLEFGKEDRKTLTQKDLEGNAMQELRGFFSEDATIVLNSCSTGDDFGLGEMLSRLVKIKVIAPDSPTSLRSLKVTSRGVVSAEYRKGVDNENNPLRAYVSGKLEVGKRSEIAQRIEDLV